MSRNLNKIKKKKIKNFVTLSGRNIISEIDQDDQWILQVKHGGFVVSIVYPKKAPHNNYMIITISVNLHEKNARHIKRDL